MDKRNSFYLNKASFDFILPILARTVIKSNKVNSRICINRSRLIGQYYWPRLYKLAEPF